MSGLHAGGVEIAFDGSAVAHQDYDKRLSALAEDTLAKGTTTVHLARTHPEVYGFLRLALPQDASRTWLAIRSTLLRLTTRWPQTSRWVFQLAQRAETLGLWRLPVFYRALLDYAFWTGVSQALEAQDVASLAHLRTELHRGPLDLLLR